jgi:hypothetical protein
MLVATVVAGCSGSAPLSGQGPGSEVATKARVEAALGKLPLYFIENQGQADPRVSYYVQGRDTSVYFSSNGVTFALTGGSVHTRRQAVSDGFAAPRARADEKATGRRWAVRQEFVGADPGVRPSGREPTAATVSYFKGPRSTWTTALPTYAELLYADLWPGIDLVYSGSESNLKYTFVVKPGADPSQIRLAYRGATSVRLNDTGQLEVSTPVGGLTEDKPYTYQEVQGRRVEVPGAYALTSDATARSQSYGFRFGAYDKSRPLVVDPAVLVSAGYIGGAGRDEAFGIAVDGAGNAYIGGETTSTEATFPATVGPDLTSNVPADAFVAKVNAAGTGLVYAGYIGGSSSDGGAGIAVDNAGNAYVGGTTFSSDFPTTLGPDLSFNGEAEGFVAKVNAAGTGLVYSGYIGGDINDILNAITVDGAGNAYVAGHTNSKEATFPDGDGFGALSGPDQTHNNTNFSNDSFVAKVNAAGTGLDYAGYIGGDDVFGFGYETATGIAVDGAGNAYVAGRTDATEASFPDGDGFGTLNGPDQTHNGGGTDSYLAKVNAEGTALVYAGYIGGSTGGIEEANGIAVDNAGNAYLMGNTNSPETSFPDGDGFGTLNGPDQSYNGGNADAYVAKVNAAGTALIYGGYIGGAELDRGAGIAIDDAGNAYVTGDTFSSEASFPVTVGPDLTFNGASDAFVAKVNAAGTALDSAGYIGGAADAGCDPDSSPCGVDGGTGIAVDGSGNAYVAGFTGSTEATFPDGDGFGTLNGPDVTHNGDADAFVAKIATASVSANRIAFASTRDANSEIYVMNADGSGQTRLTTNPAVDATPAFSRDRTKIAFSSGRTGNGDIYVMNADGSSQTRLTTSAATDAFPAFSPDGTKIAFSSSRTGNGDVYVMNADGSSQTRLTTSGAVDGEPTWSPDGTKVAFASGRTGNGDLYVMNADGSGQTRRTTSVAVDSSPDWSGDGTKLAFASRRDGNFEVYVMNADGSGQTRLTTNPAVDGEPAFLEPGKIAFASRRDGNFEVYSMNADGSGQARLTTNPAADISPDAP